MKQFEILRELLIYDTETKTEQMLLGKWHQQTYLRQGYQQPSVCKNTRSAKRGKAKRDKTRWVCTRPAVRCPWPQAVALTGIYNHVSGEWMTCHKLRGLGKDFFFLQWILGCARAEMSAIGWWHLFTLRKDRDKGDKHLRVRTWHKWKPAGGAHLAWRWRTGEGGGGIA